MSCITNFLSTIFCFCRKNKTEEVNLSKLKYLSDMTKLDAQSEVETKKSEKKKKKKKEESTDKKKKKKEVKKSVKIDFKEEKKKKKSDKKKEEEKKSKEKDKKKKKEEMKNQTIPQTEDPFFMDENDFDYHPFQEKKLYLDQEIQLQERNKQYQSEFTDYSYIIDKYIVNSQERSDNRNNLVAKEVSVLLKNKMEQYIKNIKEEQ